MERHDWIDLQDRDKWRDLVNAIMNLIISELRYSYPITRLLSLKGLQEVEASRISKQSAHEGGKVVSTTHWPPSPPPFPPRRYFWNHSVIARPERLSPWKIQTTPPGIVPATFRLEAQCLKQLCHIVSGQFSKAWRIYRNSWRHFQKFYTFYQQTETHLIN